MRNALIVIISSSALAAAGVTTSIITSSFPEQAQVQQYEPSFEEIKRAQSIPMEHELIEAPANRFDNIGQADSDVVKHFYDKGTRLEKQQEEIKNRIERLRLK